MFYPKIKQQGQVINYFSCYLVILVYSVDEWGGRAPPTPPPPGSAPDQLCLESAASTGVKRVHVKQSRCGGQSFKHSKTASNVLVFNLSPTSK